MSGSSCSTSAATVLRSTSSASTSSHRTTTISGVVRLPRLKTTPVRPGTISASIVFQNGIVAARCSRSVWVPCPPVVHTMSSAWSGERSMAPWLSVRSRCHSGGGPGPALAMSSCENRSCDAPGSPARPITKLNHHPSGKMATGLVWFLRSTAMGCRPKCTRSSRANIWSMTLHTFGFSTFLHSKSKGMSRSAAGDSRMSCPAAPIDSDRASPGSS